MKDVSIVAIVSEIIFLTANWKEEGVERLLRESSVGEVSRPVMEIFSFRLLCRRERVDVSFNGWPERITRSTRRVWDANRSVRRKVIFPSSSSKVCKKRPSIERSLSEPSSSLVSFFLESAMSSSVTTGAD